MAFYTIDKFSKACLRYVRRQFRENHRAINNRRAYIRSLYNELNDMN